MSTPHEQLDALKDIKNMMERSSRFMSLSGISGICAGCFALIGAWFAFHQFGYRDYYDIYFDVNGVRETRSHVLLFIFLDGAAVLFASMASLLFFTARRARKNKEKMIDSAAIRLLGNILIPLLTGGILCIILFIREDIALIAPCTLIFYGLALVNGSKYSLNDIRYLGFLQIGLGLLNAWYIGYGLLFWSLGFGVLHILYGSYMWFKYERGE